jgi:glycine betaine/proline transport system permease protein
VEEERLSLNQIPRIPIGEWIDNGIQYLVDVGSGLTEEISDFLLDVLSWLQNLLLSIPPELFLVIIALLAWRLVNKQVAIFSVSGLFLIYNMQLWPPAMLTLSMVLASVLLCIVIGLPLGVLAAKSDMAYRIIMPILDFMQTLPAFVYLLPAIFFFGIGVVPAIIATLIFSMPPVIRLTNLGIRQVPEELVELGSSFGSTFLQMLVKIELPLARPTIMAGINQCIMLSLSMVVIAAMIGAGGLGGEVWRGIQRMEIGLGFEAGLAIVIMAIVLDRITQNMGKTNKDGG